MAKNLASKFAPQVDEMFKLGSKAEGVTGNSYDFTGVKTVKVYSFPVVPLGQYNENTVTAAYGGTPTIMERNVQEMTIEHSAAFTVAIRQLDRLEDEMKSDASKQLARQIDQAVIPEYDNYVFRKLATSAVANGNYDSTAITASNAYAQFLAAQEALGDALAPEDGRACICTYHFYNLLKQGGFVRSGDSSQEMLKKGIIGMVDGVAVKPVPSSRLPIGCAAIFTHPYASVAPKKLTDYVIHTNPVGFNGWIIEGLVCYDCFILNNKADGIFYLGGQSVLKRIVVNTANNSSTSGNTIVHVLTPLDNVSGANPNKWYYKTGTAKETVAAGDAVTGWTAMSANSADITPTNTTDTVVTVVEAAYDGSAYKVAGVGYSLINRA